MNILRGEDNPDSLHGLPLERARGGMAVQVYGLSGPKFHAGNDQRGLRAGCDDMGILASQFSWQGGGRLKFGL